MKWKKVLFMVINKVPKDIKPKVRVFLNAVEKHFSFLKDYGYTFKEAKIATEYVVDNIIEVLYQNEKLDRLIIIHYEPIDIDEEEIDNITIMFYKGIKLRNNKLEFDMFIEKYNTDYRGQSWSGVARPLPPSTHCMGGRGGGRKGLEHCH